MYFIVADVIAIICCWLMLYAIVYVLLYCVADFIATVAVGNAIL